MSQGIRAVALGCNSGEITQGIDAVAVGYLAGQTNQGNGAVAIGATAGVTNQRGGAVAIGGLAGATNQNGSVAIGGSAGQQNQNIWAIAIGGVAAQFDQGLEAISIGHNSGNNIQGQGSIAIGTDSGRNTQGINCIAIGGSSGLTSQGNDSIAIGGGAGENSQGGSAVAIGNRAGRTNQVANSIAINASGLDLDTTTAGLYINPIRSVAGAGVSGAMVYDTVSREVLFDTNKTFVIQHPLEQDKYLVHACLEGPEAGVYYRGKSSIEDGETSVQVQLPDYVEALATDFTVHITPIYNGKIRTLNSTLVENGQFSVHGEPGPFSWMVYAKRASIEVEPKKDAVNLKGSGPYRWVE